MKLNLKVVNLKNNKSVDAKPFGFEKCNDTFNE